MYHPADTGRWRARTRSYRSAGLDECVYLLLQIRVLDDRREQDQSGKGRRDGGHDQGKPAAREEQRRQDEIDDQRLALAGHHEQGKHSGPDEMKPAAPFRLGEQDQPGEQRGRKTKARRGSGSCFHPTQ